MVHRLNMLAQFTSQKQREDVKNWPAYLITLLKKFEPDLFPAPQNRGGNGQAKNNRRDKTSGLPRERMDSKDSMASKESKDLAPSPTESIVAASKESIDVAGALDKKSEAGEA